MTTKRQETLQYLLNEMLQKTTRDPDYEQAQDAIELLHGMLPEQRAYPSYPPRDATESALYWLGQQQKWVAEHGMTAAGYVAHYAGSYPEDQALAIYEADAEVLREYTARAELLVTRQVQRRAKGAR